MRAQLQQNELGVMATRHQAALVRLLLDNAAARAYWDWVEAGKRLIVAETLLDVARQRVAGLERRIDKGDAAPILSIDNQRIVLSRKAKVARAEQKLQQNSAKLSLYYRSDRGQPIRPERSQLPLDFPTPQEMTGAVLRRDIATGRQRRPDVRALDTTVQQRRVELEFRDNQVAPAINVQGWLAKDLGSGKDDLRPLELGIGATVELSALLRKERGKRRAAQAKLAAVKQKMALAADKVEVDIRSAHAVVLASQRVVGLAQQQRGAAEQMAIAERRKFELGTADLLTVNLRELAAAAAAEAEIAARADLQRALADYAAATGRRLSPRSL